MSFVRKKLRDSARGEECTLNVYGVCNNNPETTVLAHLPDESNGMGMKADDFLPAWHAVHATIGWIDARIHTIPKKNIGNQSVSGTCAAPWCARGDAGLK